MNNFRKSKGMIVELTSLLDIILIMLFWVMISSSQSAGKVEEKAKQQVDSANAQVELEKQKAKEQTDKLKEENAALQSSVEGFEKGEMICMSIKYSDCEDRIFISQNDSKPQIIEIDENLENNLKTVFDNFAKQKKVLLAAVVYDGNAVLYRDVNKVKNAVENLKKNYDNIYFTYINATK